MIISPSILSADFGSLHDAINMINNSKADWFHIDIMDGVFVPNISFGFPVMKTLKEHAKKMLDVHLMIIEPERYIKDFKDAGAGLLTIHYEGNPHLHRTLQDIKHHGMKTGVALNPHTPVSVLSDIIHDIDVVLIMSVNPGFGGQKFIQNTFDKIRRLSLLIKESGAKTKIEVDGGINLDNGYALMRSGADIIVAGNSVFSSTNPIEYIKSLKDIK